MRCCLASRHQSTTTPRRKESESTLPRPEAKCDNCDNVSNTKRLGDSHYHRGAHLRVLVAETPNPRYCDELAPDCLHAIPMRVDSELASHCAPGGGLHVSTLPQASCPHTQHLRVCSHRADAREASYHRVESYPYPHVQLSGTFPTGCLASTSLSLVGEWRTSSG